MVRGSERRRVEEHQQWSFVVPEYPDTTYYLYAKSPVMWSLDNDPLYRFHGTQPNDLPADFFGGR